mmetsp:Transcript_46385/g.122467  ORF Transcript_46385/g.122467 Transcript_46385/m.122467 type:complete len:144 (+) Transcript_46385:333-764(+)
MKGDQRGATEIIASLVKTTGFRGFFDGLGASVGRDTPGAIPYWLTYEYSKKWLNPRVGDWAGSALGGVAAGIAFWAFMLPLDTIKTQAQAQAMNSKDALAGLIAEGGVLRLYRGFGVAIVRGGTINGLLFLFADSIREGLSGW